MRAPITSKVKTRCTKVRTVDCDHARRRAPGLVAAAWCWAVDLHCCPCRGRAASVRCSRWVWDIVLLGFWQLLYIGWCQKHGASHFLEWQAEQSCRQQACDGVHRPYCMCWMAVWLLRGCLCRWLSGFSQFQLPNGPHSLQKRTTRRTNRMQPHLRNATIVMYDHRRMTCVSCASWRPRCTS